MTFDDLEFSSPAPGVIQQTHAAHLCTGQPCVIHNPSGHHMRTWPTEFRIDRACVTPPGYDYRVFVLTERTCEHGVGHPDPDSLGYAQRIGGDRFAQAESVHGCDGCCCPADADGSGVPAGR